MKICSNGFRPRTKIYNLIAFQLDELFTECEIIFRNAIGGDKIFIRFQGPTLFTDRRKKNAMKLYVPFRLLDVKPFN